MDSTWKVIYQHPTSSIDTTTVVIQPDSPELQQNEQPAASPSVPVIGQLTQSYGPTASQIIGFILLALGLGGFLGPLIPAIRLESAFAFSRLQSTMNHEPSTMNEPPASTPALINALVATDGSPITPVNTDFSIIIPKIGVNAPVIANVDPTKPETYDAALLQGVAQSSTSFTPDQNGTTYLFSHSTNYDWFVKDLNAVFYLLKNLAVGDKVYVYYQGKQYAYVIRQTKIVSPKDINYLVPVAGTKSLILETCWPPGSTAQRLLVLADLVDVGK